MDYTNSDGKDLVFYVNYYSKYKESNLRLYNELVQLKEKFINALNSFEYVSIFKSVIDYELCRCGYEDAKTLLMYACDHRKIEIVKHVISIEPDTVGVKRNGMSVIDWINKCSDESIRVEIMRLIKNTEYEEETNILIKYPKYSKLFNELVKSDNCDEISKYYKSKYFNLWCKEYIGFLLVDNKSYKILLSIIKDYPNVINGLEENNYTVLHKIINNSEEVNIIIPIIFSSSGITDLLKLEYYVDYHKLTPAMYGICYNNLISTPN